MPCPRTRSTSSRLDLALLVLAGLTACDDAATTTTEAIWPGLSVGKVEPAIALPGTHVRVFASGLVPGDVARYEVSLVGAVDGVPVALTTPAERVSDEILEVPLGTTLTDALQADAGLFSGELTVTRVPLVDDAHAAASVASASRPFELALTRALSPLTISLSATELYLGDAIVVAGDGLLLPGEGTTLARFDGTFVAESARPIEGLVVPGVTATAADYATSERALSRAALRFTLTPDVFGIRPGRFEGTLRLVNVHADGREASSEPIAVGPLMLRPPVLTAVSPLAASRGQIITVLGRGLLAADGLAQTATVLLLEGVFSPRRGVPEAYDGVSAIVIYPEIGDAGRRATAVLRVSVLPDGRLAGLGANAGLFTGTLTPLVLAGPDAVEGPSLPLEFRVLSPRQVVHIRFLPGFSDALVRFGLLAERGAIESRILHVLERDYRDFNLSFTYQEPSDFAEYTVVEVGGYDPNGTRLFGLDNTSGKDVGNLRFDDVIGGFNAETREQNFAAYGGIFVAELMNLSPTLNPLNELASPRFDAIFGPVVPELGGDPARLGETGRGGPRAAAVAEAVRVLGNLIGSTITHEVAHSLGLTAIEGRYHNEGDTPNWIMDAGQYRPFEERAEIDGFGPAHFEPFNRDYLMSILPRDDGGAAPGGPPTP